MISPSAVVNAMINPANIDFSGSDYKFKLEDSKGKSVLNISEIKQNKSVKPLKYTRATEEELTTNKGIYDLVIALNKGSKEEAVKDANKVAYALSTKDAWGNEIISDYDIKVKTNKSTTAPSFSSTQQTGAINESLDLNKLATDAGFDSTQVVAFYYELANSPIQDVTFDKTNKTIKSTKGQTVNVKVCYLTMTGEIYDGKERAGQTKAPFTFDIKFTQTIDVNFKIAKSFDWVADNPSLTQQSLDLTEEQMKPIIAAAGVGYATIATDKFTTYNTEDAYFTVGASNALSINIKRGFKGTAKAKVEIEVSDVLTINVVADVEVAYMSDVTLMPSILWDTNKKVGLPVIYDFVSGEKLQAVNLGLDLVDLFDNYGDMKTKVKALGGEIEHVATPEAIASSISGTNFEFDAKDYKGGAITVTSQVKYGEDAVGGNNIASFILRNPTLLAGTLTVPSAKEAAHEITNTDKGARREPVILTTGFKWLDGRSTKDKEIQMWPTLATEDDGTVKYYVTGTTPKKALAMYGLKVTYAFDDKDADTKKYKNYFESINQDEGTVKLTEEAAGYPTIGQDINVRIIVTATCPWMDLGAKKETVLTVTVKAW